MVAASKPLPREFDQAVAAIGKTAGVPPIAVKQVLNSSDPDKPIYIKPKQITE